LSVRIMQFALISAATLVCARGQWLSYPTPGTPRARDGTPNVSAKPPRAPNGKPDLSGVWHTESAPAGEIERLLGPDVKTYAVPGARHLISSASTVASSGKVWRCLIKSPERSVVCGW
jgi:hypothetical protein